jgi:hypothetical protein
VGPPVDVASSLHNEWDKVGLVVYVLYHGTMVHVYVCKYGRSKCPRNCTNNLGLSSPEDCVQWFGEGDPPPYQTVWWTLVGCRHVPRPCHQLVLFRTCGGGFVVRGGGHSGGMVVVVFPSVSVTIKWYTTRHQQVCVNKNHASRKPPIHLVFGSQQHFIAAYSARGGKRMDRETKQH